MKSLTSILISVAAVLTLSSAAFAAEATTTPATTPAATTAPEIILATTIDANYDLSTVRVVRLEKPENKVGVVTITRVSPALVVIE